MEGQVTPAVDNSTPAVTPDQAAPDFGNAAPAADPQATPTPPVIPQFQPGDRSRAALEAILSMPEGTDPATLFQAETQAALQAAASAEPAPTPEANPPAPADPGIAIPDKFKNPDGTPNVEAMAKSYTELERAYGEQGNKLGVVSQLQQELQQLRSQLTQPPAPQAQPEPVVDDTPKFPWEEEMTPEQREKALEEYYADPIAAQAKRDQQTMRAMEHRVAKTLESALKPLAPVIQKHQLDAEVSNYKAKISDFAVDHPDMDEVAPVMASMAQAIGHESIKAMEAAGKNPLEALYNVAKSLQRPEPAAPPTPEQMIKDPNYRQTIVGDQGIKNEILKSTMEAAQKGAPPPVIGAQLGGVPPAAPAEHAGSAKEAGRMAARFFGA